jgi:Rrf2 family transcriptional regulator, nitric oxide-sensitive transcriptional repressor
MRLTTFSDYTLRVLMYLALHPDRFATIPEIAEAFGVSVNHLMKVVQRLAASGDVETLRGPRGGLRLSRPAQAIRVGSVIRAAEPDMALAPCAGCIIQTECTLSEVLDQAVAAFMAVLDKYTVADLVARQEALRGLLGRQFGGGGSTASGMDRPEREADAPA